MVLAWDIKKYLSKKGFKAFFEGNVEGTIRYREIVHHLNDGTQSLELKELLDHYCEAWCCGPKYTETVKRKDRDKAIERWQIIFVYRRSLEDKNDQDAKQVLSISRGYSGHKIPDKTLYEERLEGAEIDLKWKDFINRTPMDYIDHGFIDDILDEKYKDTDEPEEAEG